MKYSLVAAMWKLAFLATYFMLSMHDADSFTGLLFPICSSSVYMSQYARLTKVWPS